MIALNTASKLPALRMADQTLARNRHDLLAFTIPVTALGFMLFMVGILLMVYEKGKPVSPGPWSSGSSEKALNAM